MGSKKKETTTTNQTSEAAPPSWALPQMQAIANGIMGGLNTIGGIPAYTGDFTALPGTLQHSVPQGYLDAAAMARSLIDPAKAALNMSTVMPTFDYNNLVAATQGFGSTNPGGMDAAIRAAIDPAYKILTEQALPGIQSAGIESGAYGGSRAMLTLPQLALRDFSDTAGNIAAEYTYKDFEDTANRMLEAYGLSTTRGLGEANVLTDRLGLTPDLLDAIMRMSGGAAELTGQAANIDTANREAVIQNELQKYQYQMTQPFMGYDVATDLITRLAGNYGTQTQQGTSTTVSKTGGLAPIIGAALGGAMSLASLPMGGGGSLGGSLVSQLFGRKPT
jgi:hypothetical protein